MFGKTVEMESMSDKECSLYMDHQFNERQYCVNKNISPICCLS